ncbi:nucleoside hydrolase [Candidatus Poribacteria bacterium]
MKRVILDMDPGVDDALAIILAMLSPQLRVEAITTVSGNVHVDLCTQNVLRILEILKPETPPIVARGEAEPLTATVSMTSTSPIDNITGADVHGQDGLGNLDKLSGDDGQSKRYPEPSLYHISSDHAVDVILSAIADHPHEITLIPTGPLTNIARAIIQYPEQMRKVKELIIMGGAFNTPGNATAVAEANILGDPHAADVVVNSGLPVTFVGLDVTRQVQLKRSYIEREIRPLKTRISQFICDITDFYIDFYNGYYGIAGCYMHDPLAVGIAIEPDIVETTRLYVQVETQGKITSGMTIADLRPVVRHGDSPNASICTGVDADRFLTLFLETIKGQ